MGGAAGIGVGSCRRTAASLTKQWTTKSAEDAKEELSLE